MWVYDVCDLDDGKPQNYLLSSVKSMRGEMPSKQHKRWKGTKSNRAKKSNWIVIFRVP